MVQWLGLDPFTVKFGQGTKILQAAWQGQKKKKKEKERNTKQTHTTRNGRKMIVDENTDLRKGRKKY